MTRELSVRMPASLLSFMQLLARLFLTTAVLACWGTLTRAQELLPGKQLRVISYNVQFLPSIAASANKRPQPVYRAKKIGQLLTEYDVIGLNELFAEEPRDLLLAEIKQVWGDSFHAYLSPKVDAQRFPGGLAIISRLPIIETNWHTYTQYSKSEQNGLKADGFVSKGVMHVRLATQVNRASESAIDLFVTHMEARDRKFRPSQYTEFAKFLAEHSSPERPAILMGDFNTQGNTAQLEDQQSDYHLMTKQFKQARPESSFSDLWITIGDGVGGTSDQLSADGGRRIDYIFLLNPANKHQQLSPQKTAVNRFLDPRVVALSDHSAVEAVLGLAR